MKRIILIGLIVLGSCVEPIEEVAKEHSLSEVDSLIRDYDLRKLKRDKEYLLELSLYDSVREAGIWIPQPVPPVPLPPPMYVRIKDSMSVYGFDSLCRARMEVLEETRRLLFQRMEDLDK